MGVTATIKTFSGLWSIQREIPLCRLAGNTLVSPLRWAALPAAIMKMQSVVKLSRQTGSDKKG